MRPRARPRAATWLLRLIADLRADQRGLMALQFALALPALALLGAGAIDLAHVQSSKDRLQAIADSAALAGATDLSLATDGSNAVQRASAFVQGQLSEWDDAPRVAPRFEILTIDRQRAIKVRLEGHRPSFFGNLLPPGGWTFSVQSSATSIGMVPLCVLVTGEQNSQMLRVKDSGRIAAPACLVHSNRDIVVDGGSITAASVQAVTSATGTITPAPGTGAARIDDPFAALPLNRSRGLDCLTSALLQPLTIMLGSRRIPPGVHCGGIEVGGSATIVLEPGEHWFLGGHLIIKEDARLEGEDVVLFFDKASKFDFKDRALVNLDGRKTGPYAGIVMAGTRDNTQDFVISSDNVESLLGVIYVPQARLIVEGRADVARDSAWTVLVAHELQLKGSPSLFVNANYGASDVPVPEGVGPRASGSQLVR